MVLHFTDLPLHATFPAQKARKDRARVRVNVAVCQKENENKNMRKRVAGEEKREANHLKGIECCFSAMVQRAARLKMIGCGGCME